MSPGTGKADRIHKIEDIVIVGGGDAGLMTALALKNSNQSLNITIIDDFDEPIPQIGKSTISYIVNFLHEILDIEITKFNNEVHPVWKGSVYFESWGDRGPFQIPFDGYSLDPPQLGARRFEVSYLRHQNRDFLTLGEEMVRQRKTPISDNGEMYTQVAYHLSLERFNTFLRKECEQAGITLTDDRIIDVEADSNWVTRISGESESYRADLYLDASGYDPALMSHLDNEFKSFDFPLDSAVVSKSAIELDEIVPATVINSGECGWFWQIDTYDWRDVGYVYSSSYISQEDAIAEFRQAHPETKENPINTYSFESGMLDRAWIGNCVAIGNTLGFVEPLQSTALTLNAMLTEYLAELIGNHHSMNHTGIRNIYNANARDIWLNTFDFVSLHYHFAKGDTPFWQEVSSGSPSQRLQQYIDHYQENGFMSHEEFDRRGAELSLFGTYLYFQLMRELGVRSEFFDEVDLEISQSVTNTMDRRKQHIKDNCASLLEYPEVYQKGLDDPFSVILRETSVAQPPQTRGRSQPRKGNQRPSRTRR